MKEVSFGITSVQKGRRIALDDNLLNNLNIKEGDSVELFLNTETEGIIIKKALSIKSKDNDRNKR